MEAGRREAFPVRLTCAVLCCAVLPYPIQQPVAQVPGAKRYIYQNQSNQITFFSWFAIDNPSTVVPLSARLVFPGFRGSERGGRGRFFAP